MGNAYPHDAACSRLDRPLPGNPTQLAAARDSAEKNPAARAEPGPPAEWGTHIPMMRPVRALTVRYPATRLNWLRPGTRPRRTLRRGLSPVHQRNGERISP